MRITLLNGGSSTGRCALASICSADVSGENVIHLFIKLNFEPHNELTLVSLVEGVGGKLVVATKDEMKLKVVLWKVTDMRDNVPQTSVFVEN